MNIIIIFVILQMLKVRLQKITNLITEVLESVDLKVWVVLISYFPLFKMDWTSFMEVLILNYESEPPLLTI